LVGITLTQLEGDDGGFILIATMGCWTRSMPADESALDLWLQRIERGGRR
jgi:hypothetical protein